MKRTGALGVLALLGLGACSGLFIPAYGAVVGKYFDYAVTILMENNGLQSVLSQGPYESSLASQYTLATGYSGVSHPSEPNYSALISGQIGPNSNDGICCGQDTHRNLVDSLEAQGLAWRAYAEGLSSGDCTGLGIDRDHFPFLYFSDITNNPSRCANLVGATWQNDTEIVSVLNATSGWPNYTWLTPNNNNDAHNTSIAFGDSYLSNLVPRIQDSTLFRTQRAALFIVYDEGKNVSCLTGGPDCVFASWSGPTTKKGFPSNNAYTHYSYLHTVEDNWGLPTLTSSDANGPVMAEFFTGYASGSCLFCFHSVSITLLVIGGVLGIGATVAFAVVRSRRGQARRIAVP